MCDVYDIRRTGLPADHREQITPCVRGDVMRLRDELDGVGERLARRVQITRSRDHSEANCCTPTDRETGASTRIQVYLLCPAPGRVTGAFLQIPTLWTFETMNRDDINPCVSCILVANMEPFPQLPQLQEPTLRIPALQPPSLGIPPLSIDPSLQPAATMPQSQASLLGIPPLSLDATSQPSLGLTPPLDVTSLLPPDLRLPPQWLLPQPDGPNNHWADPAPPSPPQPPSLEKKIENLGTRRGLQIDGRGIGTGDDGWHFRFRPITPLTPDT